MEECVPRRLYKVWCRNLTVAVYDGNGGFCGIRTKFGDRYLFTELHWDKCQYHGTVRAMRDTGVDLPAGIPIEERLGSVDSGTGRQVHFKFDEGKTVGKWYFDDTGEHGPDIQPRSVHNEALFDFLDKFEYLGEDG